MKGTLDVAVKMLNNKATEKDVVRFLQEAAIMGQFRHPNIVRLHGVVTVGEPVSYGRVERVRREGEEVGRRKGEWEAKGGRRRKKEGEGEGEGEGGCTCDSGRTCELWEG